MVSTETTQVEITDVSDILVSAELSTLFERFPDIDEFEYELLTPFVMEYYLESYKNGNKTGAGAQKPEEENIFYISPRFILIGTKLGMASDNVKAIMVENRPIMKEFREKYKPFTFHYREKFEIAPEAITAAQKGENVLEKGVFRLKWETIDYKKNIVKNKAELDYPYIKKVQKAIK